jgi:hypothetical protein
MLNESCRPRVRAISTSARSSRPSKRAAPIAVLRQSQEGNCSGAVVLPDGSEHCNPGVRTRWIGTELPQVAPRVVSDDPSTVRELVAHAAELFIEEDHHDNRD